MQSFVLLIWLTLCAAQDARQRHIANGLTLGAGALGLATDGMHVLGTFICLRGNWRWRGWRWLCRPVVLDCGSGLRRTDFVYISVVWVTATYGFALTATHFF